MMLSGHSRSSKWTLPASPCPGAQPAPQPPAQPDPVQHSGELPSLTQPQVPKGWQRLLLQAAWETLGWYVLGYEILYACFMTLKVSFLMNCSQLRTREGRAFPMMSSVIYPKL